MCIGWGGSMGEVGWRPILRVSHSDAFPLTSPSPLTVGKPLPLPKIENPSNKTVAKYHTNLDALRQLFDQYKTKFGFSEAQELVSVT